MQPTDPPEEDIAAYQAGWNVPGAALEAVVRKATGASVGRAERILEGHGNEVHGVTTADGQEVIVRVAWRPGLAFERERWPAEAARQAGVPVPEILLIEHTELDGHAVSFEVQRRAPGVSLYRLGPSLSDGDLARLIEGAGRLLAAVHSVRTAGRGPIGPGGQVDPSLAGHHEDSIHGMAERTAFLLDLGVEPALVEGAASVVASSAALLEQSPLCLVHGDWRITNVLTDGTSITGVVDWEGARGGDPAFDLAGSWDVWSNRGSAPSEALGVGYREAGGSMDEGFDRRLLVYRIAEQHDAVSHFIATGRPDLLDRALGQLRLLLRQAEEVL